MSQDIYNNIVPSSTSGNQLAEYLNDFKDAVVTGFSGTSRPANLQAGGYWIDTTDTGSGFWDYKMYDGTQDILIFTINMNTGSVVLPAGEDLVRIVKSSNDAVAPQIQFYKRRIAGDGQTEAADAVGEIEFNARNDASTEVTIARIRAVAQEDITATQQGSYIAFEASTLAAAAYSEIMRLIDGKVGIGVTAPSESLHVAGHGKFQRVTNDAVGAQVKLKKARVASLGQVVNNDVVSLISAYSTDDTGAEIEVAQIEVKASQNHTGANQGSTFTIRTKVDNTSTFVDSLVIQNGVLVTLASGQYKNNLIASAAPTVNEDSGDGYAAGSLWYNATTNLMYVCESASVGAAVWQQVNLVQSVAGKTGAVTLDAADISETTSRFWSKKHNLTAVAAPTVNDDSGDNYSAGSQWYDQSTNRLYVAEDVTLGAALWQLVSGGGSGGSKNYITNGDAEADTTGWSTYADAAGTSIVDATGGAANVTWTRNTTTPLSGTGDFVFTKDAANRQGQGASYDFTIDRADRGRVVRIKADYAASANYGEGFLRAYIYDVTNSRVIEPVPVEITASAQGHLFVDFQASIDSTSYRLAFHVATTETTAWTVNFDSISVGPLDVARGPVITDWTSFTPTGSWVSNTTYTGRFRRVGDTAEYEVNILLTGAPTATDLNVTLPSGHVIDTAKLVSTNTTTGGLVPGGITTWRDDGVSNGASCQIYYVNSTTVAPTRDIGTGLASGITETVPHTWGANDFIRMSFKLPIAGWGSAQISSSDLGQRLIVMRAYRSSNQAVAATTATKIQFDSTEIDTTNAFDKVTNFRFTAPEAGAYQVNLRGTVGSYTASEQWAMTLRKNGSDVRLESPTSAASSVYSSISTILQLNKGDYLEGFGQSTADTSYNILGDATGQFSYFEVFKIASPQQVAAGELIVASYTTNAAQAVTGGNIILYEDRVVDTHSAYNTSTGVFTAPVAGNYFISAKGQTQGVSASIGNAFILVARKNSSDLLEGRYDYCEDTTARLYESMVSGIVTLNKGETLDIVMSESLPAVNMRATGIANYLHIYRIGGIA